MDENETLKEEAAAPHSAEAEENVPNPLLEERDESVALPEAIENVLENDPIPEDTDEPQVTDKDVVGNDMEGIINDTVEKDQNVTKEAKDEEEKNDPALIPQDVPSIINDIDEVEVIEPSEVEQPDPNLTPPPPIELNDEVITEETEDIHQDGVMVKQDDPDEQQEDAGATEEEDAGATEEKDAEDLPVYSREQLLLQYKEAIEERAKINQLNHHYQHKLAEYFKKKKPDDRVQEIEKNVTDQEQRYLKYMSNMEELEMEESRQASSIEVQLEDLKEKCQEKIEKVEEATNAIIKFKYEVAKTAVNSRSGKTIPIKDIEQYQALEAKKEQEVIAVRLDNIKLKNRLKKREMQLKAKEELAEGLHLIDFEQLKIENQTYNEKIEERNEELLKLRKKITTTVQVLTHLKEKLQFVQGENREHVTKLREVEMTVAQRRDILTRFKQVRDGLRMDNTKLKHKSGLLGNKPLLRDFEERKDEGDDLQKRLKELKEQHIELNMNLTGIRKKIEKSKTDGVT